MSSVTAIYEVRATGVKLVAKNHAEASAWLLLPGAGGVGLQRPDPFGKRPAAAVGSGTARFRQWAERHWPVAPPSAGSRVPPPAWPRSANSAPRAASRALRLRRRY